MRNFLRGSIATLLLGVLLTGCNSDLIQNDEATGEIGQENLQYSKANTFIQLAAAYLERGNYTASLSNARKGVEMDKRNPNAFLMLGRVHEILGETDLAKDNYEKAIKLDKKNPYVLNAYGSLLCQQKKYDESLVYFLRALENPLYSTPWAALGNAGMCARSSSNPAQAEGFFRRALEYNKRYPTALAQMAGISFDKGNALSARAYIERYREVARPTAELLWLGVRVERELNNPDQVQSYALQLRARFPDSKEVQWLNADS